jgi:hypothetical protein
MSTPTIVEGDAPDARAVLTLGVGADGAVNCAIRAQSASAPTLEDVRFANMLLRGVCDAKTEVRPDAATFRPAKDWLGAQQREKIADVQTHVYEATARVRTTQVNIIA